MLHEPRLLQELLPQHTQLLHRRGKQGGGKAQQLLVRRCCCHSK